MVHLNIHLTLAAVGISADELQVWKEVDGIFTAVSSSLSLAVFLFAFYYMSLRSSSYNF